MTEQYGMVEQICYGKEEMLRMIANTLTLYAYHIENNGLLDGKSGVMLFLYRYAAHTDNDNYGNVAGNILDGIMKITLRMAPGFENGLAGVGWTISRLLSEDIVSGKPSEVLARIDDSVFVRTESNDGNISGQAVYLAERLKDKSSSNVLSRYIEGMLGYINHSMRHNNLTLRRVNSMLFFLVSVKDMPYVSDKIDHILSLMPHLYERMDVRLCNPCQDMYIHKMLLDLLGAGNPSLPFLSKGKPSCANDEVEIFLDTAWQEMIYFGRLHGSLPAPALLSRFLDEKMQSLRSLDFCVRCGMAGLGLALLASDGDWESKTENHEK
ncbi:hypothetical protein [Leyella lascolaii]|jgi:hypothetical protein|uniref:hypothetical protein n=1 Tax=Leyella lascolaii TaxID=1776379 RepID=UPI002352E0E6|nr:hypothetical protein [Leyella lascolaii]